MKRKQITGATALSVELSQDSTPPTEFRIFKAGWNDTEKGRFLFDASAARSVMAAYEKWGIDVPIDLEHQMLGPTGSDPTQRDARGWCRLELRNGELWAVAVTWTPDGAARLTDRRQRYVSPFFGFDKASNRILKVINVAITALPATHDTPALVAANIGMALAATKGNGNMDPKLVKAALDAVEKGDAKAALEILKGLIASAAGAEADPDASTEDAPPPAGDGGADEMTESAAPPPAADAPPAAPDDQKKKDQAAMSGLVKLSGKASMSDAVEEIHAWRTSHLELEAERAKVAADRAVLESAERRRLCVELIKLGAEFPATMWADDKAVALKPRWVKMPLAELRAHTAEQRAARGKKSPSPPVKAPTASPDHAALGLTDQQLAMCKEMGCDPAVFASLKAPSAGVDK